MGDEVERVVERSDGDDHAYRHPFEVAAALLAAGEGVEGNGLAEQALGLLAGDRQGVDGAFGLAPGLLDRLGSLAGDRLGEVLEVVGDDFGGREQDLRPVEGRHRPRGGARRIGGGEGGLDVVRVGSRDGVDEGVVEGIADVDGLFAVHPLIGQQHLHLQLLELMAMRSMRRAKPVSRRPAPGPTIVTSPRVSVVMVMALVAPPTPASGCDRSIS